ncbi:alpha-mannosidase [Paenibacillus chondroitinus]|uniref:Alpha-mannosidase n=1 Tax=Paenibacillus chondroitinus TaxID=59842 RepID=A0ABU6D8L6_9BACL|nr:MULTISPECIES: alpha-mannosidase [Paenibacillus]MCY9661716.1 alpha-mannosidase [Paenibacillus anseongense]MEB4793801.1 alpha-mannosidase [Paenibacillus chondroitinus]
MTKKSAHLISHSHWDREWYMPYERHHYLLTELMNDLLDTLERDPEYRYFHLDGQTIIIEDYLQVHPEKREQLEAYIKAGRIIIGPWYVLQDEFLTSSEANVRNLLIGHQDAAKYGVISKLGYFPDSFGNMGQAPQLLKQADIDTAVFGRGVKPTGFDNVVIDAHGSGYESPYSEMYWSAPDGSKVIGVLFANWYSNGNEVPVEAEAAKAFWDKRLGDAQKYASTSELLFMNGCDHQPIQRDLSEAIDTAKALYPDVDFIHSSFEQYIDALKKQLPDDMVTIQGELRSQHTDGWGTLVNTASARVYLKQLNQLGQTLLEKGAEPLATLAHLAAGKAYPHQLLTHAWKTLMQNHPHDSICGCSVDEVHREMITRFDKSRYLTETIIDESLQVLAVQIDTASVASWPKDSLPVTIYNMTGWERTGTVRIELIVAKSYFKEGPNPPAIAERLAQLPLNLDNGVLLDDQGQAISVKAEDLGVHFGYELPKDKFRQPYMARRIALTFEAQQVPALGFKTWAWVSDPIVQAEAASSPLIATDSGMTNAHISVSIHADGSYDITDKETGFTYEGIGVYENCGDLGNEYVFRQPDGDIALTTKGLPAQVKLVENEPYRVTYEIKHTWLIPASASELFEEEKRKMVPFRKRTASRSSELVPFELITRISLELSGKGVQVSASYNNQAKDHRLRVLFPTGLTASTHLADSIYEAAERDTVPAKEWINPSNAQHQQAFISVSDGTQGLTIANKGLNEYEVLRDGKNTIAVTLLRSVSELGDWGVFPTPEAQCLGDHTVEIAIYPHKGNAIQSGAFASAYQFQSPWFHTTAMGQQQGTLPTSYQALEWSGSSLALSAFKMSLDHDDVIVRLYNLAHEADQLTLKPSFPVTSAYQSDILERRHYSAELVDGFIRTTAGKCEIITYAFQHKQS